ncbi:MAG: ABC transporter substrate-binding protein [Alphaproteobacteria bacterium]|nr:MAG: ABC transporter substrate-binding protein [Alphaproteobacteria bacterium]
MKRRHLLAGAIAAAAAPARAQKVPRVGILFAADPEPTWTMFRKAMADLGYVEGRTVVYDKRIASRERGDLDALAKELVESKVDVIVPVLSPAIAAVKAQTTTIPIVFNGGAPQTGMVGSMARPEANLTGVTSASSTLAGKALQLFHELKPITKGFGLLLNTTDPFHVPLQRDVEAVARANLIETLPVLLKSGVDLSPAMETMARRGVDGVLVQPSLGLEAAAALALKHRLPAISFRREFVEVGGLLSYGGDQGEINRGVAAYVDRILKGAKPADLPVVNTAKVELVVNRKTARALGFDFPPMFLARVDEVIE